MTKPSIAELRRANERLEKQVEEQPSYTEAKPPLYSSSSSSSSTTWYWYLLVFIVILFFCYSRIGSFYTLMLVASVGPSRLKEWINFLLDVHVDGH